jgi:hypothetical protein
MGKHRMGRAGYGKRGMGVVLAAMLVMTMAATAAFADEHEGVYPPEPTWGDLVCTPEVAEPGETVTCTASGAEGFAELEVEFMVFRETRRDFEEVQYEDLTVEVDDDGTAVFSFVVSDDAEDGDWYEVYAWAGLFEDCYALDWETDEVLGTGALESDDDEIFVLDGVEFSWEEAYLYCADVYDAWFEGEIAVAVDDDTDGAGPTPTPTPPTTPAAAPKLPTTGASALLLAVLGMVALGGGATAVVGSRRLARREG